MNKEEQKAQHCCDQMDHFINYNWGFEYDPIRRHYTAPFDEKRSKAGVRLSLTYCPICGTKLPKDLGDEWEEILYNEYGLIGDTASEFPRLKSRGFLNELLY